MTRILLLASAAHVFLAGASFAQEEGEALAAKAAILEAIPALTADAMPAVDAFLPGQGAKQLLATDLLGRALHDPDGRMLGTIDDMLVDDDRRLAFVVVDVGELLGAGKRIAFAIEDLRHEQVGSEIRLVAALTHEAIEAAPDFTSLSEEMASGDGQSLTQDEASGEPVAPEPSN